MTTTDPAVDNGEPTPKKQTGKGEIGIATVRVNHVIKVIRCRHEDGLPDDPDGREMLRTCVRLAIHIKVERAAKLEEIYRLAPWVSQEERDELERQAFAEQWWPTIDEIGAIFGVTKKERHELEVWQLGAIDESAEEREAARKDKAKDRAAEWRKRGRASRLAEGGKASAADREARLLKELPSVPTKIKDIAALVKHLPEWRGIKDVAGDLHKRADALKARGFLVDEPRREGRKPSRWVRRARDSDRQPKPAAVPAATTLPWTGTEYLEYLRLKLEQTTNVDEILPWLYSPAQVALRKRCRLTDEQKRLAPVVCSNRASKILGFELKLVRAPAPGRSVGRLCWQRSPAEGSKRNL